MRLFSMVTIAMACLLSACSQAPKSQSTDSVQTAPEEGKFLDPEGDFTLHVSNQSFAITPVDIRIQIDGQTVVNGDFDVENQHNWKTFKLALAPGKHVLFVSSTKGEAELVKEFQVEGEQWAVIDFWYYPESHYSPTPRKFSFHLQNTPVYFQ